MALGQGRGSALWVLVFLCALAGVLLCAQATEHQVGGTPGWSLPSLANVNYTFWASTQVFVVGDTLYFNYSKQYHNVLEVTKANYESCNTANPKATYDDGATIIQLNKTGTFYFICGFPTHCSQGQKVAVKVVKATATHGPSPSPSPSSVESSPTSSSAPAASSPSSSSIGTPGKSTPAHAPASTGTTVMYTAAIGVLAAAAYISVVL